VASCTLEVGDRVILLAKGGPPEAEFALFDPGDIELASTGPGQVREVGYRTTADDALRRLEAVGVTRELAEEAAAAMIPVIATTYARGPVARRVAPLLGAGELFDGAIYDYELRRYEGRWLDLPALALDLELSRATTLMQSLALVTLLSEVPPRTFLLMTTREYASERRPGERSYRRVPLDHVFNLKTALQTLAARGRRTPSPEREVGPTREELIAALHERGAATGDAEAKARLETISGAMGLRQKPLRGPLADPELWALEEQLTAGNAAGTLERIDAIEKVSGRSPATSYLRARSALLTGRESARIIAERASGLAMTMTSFAECELLAAEAWTAAGDVKRAVPFARDLISNKEAHEDVRARARQIIEAAERAGKIPTVPPPDAQFQEDVPLPPPPKLGVSARPPPLSLPPPGDPDELDNLVRTQPRSISDELTLNVHNPSSYPPQHPARPPDLGPLLPRKETPPLPLGLDAILQAESMDLPPILALSAPSPGISEPRAPRTPTLGGPPPSAPRQRAVPPVPSMPSRPPMPKSAAPATVKPPRSSKLPPPTEREEPTLKRLSGRPPSPEAQLRKATWAVEGMMRGASQPPYRSDSPGAHAYIPKAPRVPVTPGGEELAETLAMPPGLTGSLAPLDTLPSSVIDARVQFTFLARDLAREYREEQNVELRVDLASIEAMQAYLFERYPDKRITTVEEAIDVMKHGAMLSEVLARTLDAFWVDIAPSDLGYWAMVVPPDTRVWPFGRILRLIAMQHKERDLVAYFLELQARAK
jgi:hypothetical protein